MRISPVPSEIQQQARCGKSEGPDFFSPLPQDVREAKNFCESCPVRLGCLQWALKNQETYGVWGGADQWELRIALAVTPLGAPVKKARHAKCPFCRSTRFVTEVRELSGRGSQANCAKCGLRWRRARSYVKKERLLQPEVRAIRRRPELPDVA